MCVVIAAIAVFHWLNAEMALLFNRAQLPSFNHLQMYTLYTLHTVPNMFPTFVYRKPLKIYKMKRHNGSQTQPEPSFNANMLHLFGQNVLSVGFCSGFPTETTWTQLPKLREVHRLLIILSQHPFIPILILLIRFAMFAYSVLSNWNKEHRQRHDSY